MKVEVIFYQKVLPYRVQLGGISNKGQAFQAALYIKNVLEFGKTFGIDKLPKIDLPVEITNDSILPALYAIESFMSSIYARNIFDLDNTLKKEFFELDETWKQKVTSYISNIRKHVEDANVNEAIRERIFGKLRELQGEVDRNRTRMESFLETGLAFTEGIAEGAKHLEPAAKGLERLILAVSKLRKQTQQTQPVPQLPPPETLGLPEPDAGDNGDEE